MIDRLAFIIGEGLVGFRRNGFMAFAAISTIAISLFMLGGLGYLYVRVDQFSHTFISKFEIRVFLKDGTDFSAIHKTADAIRALRGVSDVSHIPRDKAWALEKSKNPDMTTGIDNPFPDQFKVVLNDLKRGDDVAEAIRKMPAVMPVEGVQYLKREQNFVDQSLGFLRWLSSLGILLFITAGILIYNAIRLAVISRRLEIRVMQLVGASSVTVQGPFVLEGVIQGLVGGLFASALVYVAQSIVLRRLEAVDAAIHAAPFPTTFMFCLLCGVGCAYGIICSLIAVKVPWRQN